MPICRTCSQKFPTSVTIDGKRKNLNSRTRCFDCAPFKDGTRGVRSDSQAGEKVCKNCHRTYLYDRKNRRSHTLTLCNSCNCNALRNAKKIKAVSYLGGKCVACGYEKCIQALSFHHPDDNKDFTIAGNYSCSWETLKAELDKCVLVCQNCHQEIHYGVTTLVVKPNGSAPS